MIYIFFLNNLENMIKKIQLHRKKGYTESSLNKCIVWQSFHFHYFFTYFILFHSLKKQMKTLTITKKKKKIIKTKLFLIATICYVVYHFLTKDLKNRFKSKQKIQKQSRVIVRLVTAIVSKCNFFGEVFWKTILPNS